MQIIEYTKSDQKELIIFWIMHYGTRYHIEKSICILENLVEEYIDYFLKLMTLDFEPILKKPLYPSLKDESLSNIVLMLIRGNICDLIEFLMLTERLFDKFYLEEERVKQITHTLDMLNTIKNSFSIDKTKL